MFNQSTGFSKEYYLWMVEEIYTAQLIYSKRYFDPTLGLIAAIWEDPFHLMVMGSEL